MMSARRFLLRGLAVLFAVVASAGAPALGQEPDYGAARAALVDKLRAKAAMPGSGVPGGKFSEPVLAAIGAVPRHELVPPSRRSMSYQDRPLPIGSGQTISQPYIVALMTELLRVGPKDTVLEVGTGSGYQAAVLSRLVGRVYTIEIVDALARRAAADLARLGYDNVTVRSGDGYKGWPEHAPFDGIIVTAAAPEIPPPLIAQLRPGARLVIPVGPRDRIQSLVVLEKGPGGAIARRDVIAVRFVPLTREPR